MTDPTVPPHVAHEIHASGGGAVPILPMLLLLATAGAAFAGLIGVFTRDRASRR